MDPIGRGSNQSGVDAQYRVMLIVWFALLAAQGLFILLTFVVPSPATGDNQTVVWALLALGLLNVVLSFLFKRSYLGRSVREQNPKMVTTALIVALALCESATLFGLLLHFIAGGSAPYLLFVIGVVGTVIHVPRREQLLSTLYKKL